MLPQAFAKAKAAHGTSVDLLDEELEPRPLADEDPEPFAAATGGPSASGSSAACGPWPSASGSSAAAAEEETPGSPAPAPEGPAAFSKQVIEARRDSKGARVVTEPRG